MDKLVLRLSQASLWYQFTDSGRTKCSDGPESSLPTLRGRRIGTIDLSGKEDVSQTSYNVRRDAEDVLKTSSNVRRDSEDMLRTSSNVDSEGVPRPLSMGMIKSFIFCAVIGSALAGYKCFHGGKEYENGETWVDRENFKMRCFINEDGVWVAMAIACLTKKGQEVYPDDQAKEDRKLYKCVRTGRERLEVRIYPL
ncbi:unnamed protein product [Heligmosomoides polygyrus]|uniref:T-cell surface glycoprotein CD3 epsilon chain n=1 Tax=Heligmosomoides polygyrus TaxID=6339 RepID=A0A3P7WVN2_HELPZ|nr:unnamed protein product [Heligmosomoides polygyrus]